MLIGGLSYCRLVQKKTIIGWMSVFGYGNRIVHNFEFLQSSCGQVVVLNAKFKVFVYIEPLQMCVVV